MDEAEATRRPEPSKGLARASEERVGRAVWWFGLVVSAFTAGVLSLEAYAEGLSELFERIPQADKAFHFGLAGLIAFFLDGVLGRRMVRVGATALPLAAVLVLVPVGVEEYLQRYSVHRTASFGDFAADVAGVAFCVWLSRKLAGRAPASPSPATSPVTASSEP